MKLQRTGGTGTVWQCYSGNHIKKNECVGMWRERVEAYTGFDGKTEGMNQLKFLGTDERIILNGSARYGSCLDWDDLLFGWRLVSGCCENRSE
jgi:hypothetical protein